ncbi:MAG: hypothetical protein QF362_02395 [Candidatus Woesearchaeota archaeon]|jgi:hypothetical protein|nr:hypothetical protein [Candidatus Woesearchaeota archaeon]MDP7506271.1 hypothetical protein [Candidatus Woesearchaeota archaeon]MDP7610596.1 hypothetical protein [Candidatus Woesearchaeota archaeon]|tara:strand:- start:6352 stop:6603 length:252 start_codon:yes stop_codon:yes gene_type:complete
MDKCEICGKDWDIKVDGKHTYCAKHYVENEDKECLYWDVFHIMQGGKMGKSEDSSKRIFEEIKKKCPNHMKRYKEENQGINSN